MTVLGHSVIRCWTAARLSMSASRFRRTFWTTHLPKCGIKFQGGSVKLCEWLSNLRSLGFTSSLISFPLYPLIHAHLHVGCVSWLLFQITSSLMASSSGFTSRQRVNDSPQCHPIHMARSCDNLLLWQAYDIQGSASGVLVRDLFRQSDAWHPRYVFLYALLL